MFAVINQPNQSPSLHGPVHILQDLAPFTGAETRISDWVRCDNKAKIFGAAFADQAGTLKVQFSASGVDNEVDHEETREIPASTAEGGFIIDLIMPWVRLSYTNGANASTVSRINAYVRSTS